MYINIREERCIQQVVVTRNGELCVCEREREREREKSERERERERERKRETNKSMILIDYRIIFHSGSFLMNSV